MQNNIFILSCNTERLKTFFKYYNIFNTPTNININVIYDDRSEKPDLSFVDKKNVFYISDVIKSSLQYIDNKELALEIFDKYKVSVKWILFIYIAKILGIQKSMIIDDDTFMLKPIDNYFEYDYVMMREQLSAMSTRVRSLLGLIYPEVDIELQNTERMFCNSGQIIYTWKDDTFLKFINRIFCNDMLDFINEGIEKYSKNLQQRLERLAGNTG